MVQLSLWQEELAWFRNEYACFACGTSWEDEWSCMCNDRCPHCDAENEPVQSFEFQPDTPIKLRLAIDHLIDEKFSGRP